MPNTDKNKDGGHSHPQKSSQNQDQKSPKNSPTSNEQGSDKAGIERKENFGSSGAKDSH